MRFIKQLWLDFQTPAFWRNFIADLLAHGVVSVLTVLAVVISL